MPTVFVLFYRPSRISPWTPQETKLAHRPLLHTSTFPWLSETGTVFLWEFHCIYTQDSSTSMVFTCIATLLHGMLSCVTRLIILILFNVLLSSFYVSLCSFFQQTQSGSYVMNSWIAMYKWAASFTASYSLIFRLSQNILIDDFNNLFQITVLNAASLQTDSKQRSLLPSLIPHHLQRLLDFEGRWIQIWPSKLC